MGSLMALWGGGGKEEDVDEERSQDSKRMERKRGKLGAGSRERVGWTKYRIHRKLHPTFGEHGRTCDDHSALFLMISREHREVLSQLEPSPVL